MRGNENKIVPRVDKMASTQCVTVFCEATECIYNCERVCSCERIAIIDGKCLTRKNFAQTEQQKEKCKVK